MSLWLAWFRNVQELRGACFRASTFRWMTFVLVGFTVRGDILGVTSFVRGLGLGAKAYPRLLHFFHSSGVCLQRLTSLWITLALKAFRPVTFGGYAVCVADGIKVPKDGRRMPGVKRLHQESSNNSKSPFIMGHSFQAISMLVSGAEDAVFSVPLVSRIHEGLVFSNRDQRSLLDKLATLFLSIAPQFDRPLILVADAFYASRKIVVPLLDSGHHLVTRVRSNAVAYEPAAAPNKPRRGRRRVYGNKVSLRKAAQETDKFQSAPSPLAGEAGVRVRYRCLDLLWRPVGHIVRFVIVDHPIRGLIFLMSTHVDLDPMDILRIYGYRFKIEVGFRQAIHVLAVYGYHFWMQTMDRLPRWSGNQHLHRKSQEYRDQVRKKLNAYHLYVQLGCIAQGLMTHIAVTRPRMVWNNFTSWFRTMNREEAPSERVVANALGGWLYEFLEDSCPDSKLRKMFRRYRDRRRLRKRRRSA